MPFKKGQSGNPKGRKPGGYHIKDLMDAIKTVERKHHKPLLMHFVERAYESDMVLTSLSKKILPDLKAIEHSGEIQSRPLTLEEIKNELKAMVGKYGSDKPE